MHYSLGPNAVATRLHPSLSVGLNCNHGQSINLISLDAMIILKKHFTQEADHHFEVLPGPYRRLRLREQSLRNANLSDKKRGRTRKLE